MRARKLNKEALKQKRRGKKKGETRLNRKHKIGKIIQNFKDYQTGFFLKKSQFGLLTRLKDK